MAKVRAALCSLRKESLLDILDRALVHVPTDALPGVLGTAIPMKEVTEGPASAKALLKTVIEFNKDTVEGAHYDSFEVNSKNWTAKSKGTEDWIAEFLRLIESCVARAPVGPPEPIRVAFEFLFDLLRRIDRGEDIVFFADEAGSWQVGVDWDEVLPAYFGCLSRSAKPAEYARVVRGFVAQFAGDDRAQYLRSARKAATAEQRKALQRGS